MLKATNNNAIELFRTQQWEFCDENMGILQEEMGEVMILKRGKDSNSYGIRLNFSQADKTIFCFDMKELQWESYMDSSVLVRRVILILIIVAWFS